MNIRHSEGDTTKPEDDYENLVVDFLCQARNQDEVQFTLNLFNIGISSLSNKYLEIIRDFIRWDPCMPESTKKQAVAMVDGQFALRELAIAA
jgi:hypothetical protein